MFCKSKNKWIKKNENDVIWWLKDGDVISEQAFSFDKKIKFDLYKDYPDNLSFEQKEIFDKENPQLVENFNLRKRILGIGYFRYTWLNFGLLREGRDLTKITVEISQKELYPKITFSTGNHFGFEVVDKSYEKLNNKQILKTIAKVEIPDKNTPVDGCDGSAWEVEIDGKVLHGYLDRPEWLEQIEEIIHFKEIFIYVDKKRKLYLEER